MKTLFYAFAFAGLLHPFAAAEDLTCLSKADQGSTLYSHLQKEAYAALDRRRKAFAALKTPADIRAYQGRLRKLFIRQLGGFPNRSPLNARTVGILKADGYQIEKVIYDSQPNHRITANLYLPDGKGPFPGIAVSSGHSRTAKTADYNQRFGIMMARQGMAALCFDPIGQGERSQIVDGKGQPKYSSTTTEHMLVGVGSTLVGYNTARYRIWDAMRSIDYLVSRPEIDSRRIGMTGCSGGGTLTSYVMALDDRVYCAAPACYLTTFRRLIETIGPQDAEQNIFGQVALGLDHPDYILLRAAKPTLISATTGDFFDIQGTWANYRQAKQIYGRLGFPERVGLVEIEGKHGVKPQNLATIAHWMKRWLLHKDEPVKAVVLKTRNKQELICTKSGQVLHRRGELSVVDLNVQRASQLAKQRSLRWKGASQDALRKAVAKKIGARLDRIATLKWKAVGRVVRKGYTIEKLILNRKSSAPLPVLAFHPAKPNGKTYLVLHPKGKTGDAAPGGAIEKLVSKGSMVLSIDLRGQGETASNRRHRQVGDYKTYYLAYLLGQSLVGLRVEDVIAASRFAKTYGKGGVHLIGVGQSGVVALHAAALRPKLFESVALPGAPRSWSSVVARPAPIGYLETAVHGALEVYDLPDLRRLAGQ